MSNSPTNSLGGLVAVSVCAEHMSSINHVLKEMREAGVEEIGLFYLGESFMVPWLPEAISYAKKIGFPYVFLTTNGSLASENKVKECMASGLDSLKFSYNYSDGDQLITNYINISIIILIESLRT